MCGNDRAHRECDKAGHGAETADAHFGDLRRLRIFLRPESPEHDGQGEKSYGQNRVERDQPGRRHLAAEEHEVGAPLRPDEIRVEDLLIADDRDGQYRQEHKQRDDRHFFPMAQRSFRGALALFYDG